MRVYDGEFYFLNKKAVGNGPKRHYSKPLTDEFVKPFREGCYNVDILSCQLNIRMLNEFNNILITLNTKVFTYGYYLWFAKKINGFYLHLKIILL